MSAPERILRTTSSNAGVCLNEDGRSDESTPGPLCEHCVEGETV